MEKAVITASDLCIGYRQGKQEKRIHEHLFFRLYPGELTCLLGANGTGKSTLLRTLAASQPALSGELLVQEKPLSAYSEKERSRTIGVVLTDKTQAGGLTVYELVALGRQPHTGFFGRLNKTDHSIIEEALEAVSISHKAHSYTAELSDGERQKVMIAKALVLADKLWLLSKENGLQCGVTEDMILSHRMDGLFSRNDIRFDYAHGVYYPKVDSHRRISVEANDEVLLHWTTNALNRHGYACHPVSSPETNESPRLQVLAADHFILHTEGQHEYHSFEQLLANI